MERLFTVGVVLTGEHEDGHRWIVSTVGLEGFALARDDRVTGMMAINGREGTFAKVPLCVKGENRCNFNVSLVFPLKSGTRLTHINWFRALRMGRKTRGTKRGTHAATSPGLIVFSFFVGSINQSLSTLKARSAEDDARGKEGCGEMCVFERCEEGGFFERLREGAASSRYFEEFNEIQDVL